MGVAMEEAEEARDSKSPKKNLISLIFARAAAAAGAPTGLGRSAVCILCSMLTVNDIVSVEFVCV